MMSLPCEAQRTASAVPQPPVPRMAVLPIASVLAETLLFSVKKTLHIGTMSPNDDARDQDRKWQQTRARQQFEAQVKHDEDRQRDGRCDGCHGNITRDLKEDQPDRKHRYDGNGHKPE